MTNLEAEADSQNEGGHTGDEAAKECIEGEGSDQTAVHELQINKRGNPTSVPGSSSKTMRLTVTY
jgi:hypothetical protein